MKPLLTKSKYLIGLQCSKYLWIAIHNKEKIPEPDRATQHIFDEGTKIGELATQWFPLGIDLSKYDFNTNITKTKEAIKERKPIFEAGFKEDNLFSRADILNPINENEWEIIEVKSSTKVKDVNVDDVAFQKHVYEKAGLKISKCYLMHINSDYIRKGELDIKSLFVLEDITERVNEIKNIPEKIKEMFKVLEEDCPEISIHKDCNKPYDCPLTECFDGLPEHNVLHLYRIGKKGFELIDSGVSHLKDVPENYKLSDKQSIQLKCAKEGKVNVNKEGIKHFLNVLKYPLYYLDFETFNTAIPMFDGLKPYSQVCFQFSLHVDDGKELKHYEFLYDGCEDPRKEFLIELKKVLGDKGSIVVYNQSFEIARLKELGLLFPEFQDWVLGVVSRVVDLIIPFRNFSYYNPKQKGSCSIKYVLPAMTGKGYSGMGIANGGDASLSFFEVSYESKGDKGKVREDLLKYCCLDTEGMVWIVKELGKLVV